MEKAKLTKNEITKIIELSKLGYRVTAIARQFNVGHATIIYHLKKRSAYLIRQKIEQSDIPTDDLLEETKTYQDYIDEEEMRHLKKQEECSHNVVIEIIRCKDCGKVTYQEIRSVQ